MWPAEAVLNLPTKLDGRLSRPRSSDHGPITSECRPPGAAILGLTETPRCRPQTGQLNGHAGAKMRDDLKINKSDLLSYNKYESIAEAGKQLLKEWCIDKK